VNLKNESITLTNPKTDSVTGRSGVFGLAGIRVIRTEDGILLIDGISTSGKVLNAGFALCALSAENFLRDIKKTFGE